MYALTVIISCWRLHTSRNVKCKIIKLIVQKNYIYSRKKWITRPKYEDTSEHAQMEKERDIITPLNASWGGKLPKDQLGPDSTLAIPIYIVLAIMRFLWVCIAFRLPHLALYLPSYLANTTVGSLFITVQWWYLVRLAVARSSLVVLHSLHPKSLLLWNTRKSEHVYPHVLAESLGTTYSAATRRHILTSWTREFRSCDTFVFVHY